MYLVELRPGKEELYRSVDELAAAIRSGDVDVHSRIFHRATSKWISITLHPQFKAISAAREQEVSEPRKQWTFLMSATDELGPGRAPETNTTEPMERSTTPPPAVSDESSSGRSWRRPFTLGFTGMLVILGAQLALSAPRPQWSKLGSLLPSALARPAVERRAVTETAATRPSVVSLAGTAGWSPVTYPLPASEVAALPVHAPVSARHIAAAPTTGAADESRPAVEEPDAKALMVDTLIQQYEAAYDEAHDRLTTELRAVDFRELFVPAQLASVEGVVRARMSMAGAREAVQAYRAQAGEIERTYQDTFTARSRELNLSPRQVLRWYARPRYTETAAFKALSEALLATADSVFELLAANPGAYRMSSGAIEFDRPDAAVAYGRLRQRLEQQLDSARAERAQGSPAVVALLVDADRIASPPVEVSAK